MRVLEEGFMELSVLNDSRYVYSKLSDDISKEVYMMQLLNNATGDIRFVTGLKPKYRNLNGDIESFYEDIHTKERIFIYGAGVNGKAIAQFFPEVRFEAYIDRYRNEKMDMDTKMPIFNIDDFINNNRYNLREITILISIINKEIQYEVTNELVDKYGIPKENIVYCVKDWRNNDSQYFDLFTPREHEVFVDCGCYDGGSCFRFAGWCGTKGYDHIYSFEPDKISYENCKQCLKKLSDCDLLPYGTAKESGKLYFVANGKEDAHLISKKEAQKLNDDCVEEIEVVSLDDFFENTKVTFIKMDIEGAEWESLQGAEEIIRKYKPRLAISVYHKMGDFVRIPKWLLDIHPDYKIYFRQYSLVNNETIMYAE